jgi:DNA-directed RNA polymerase subunit RPC12/RpoP
MPFQFTCPQGHLLEAEPFQAGQQCVCPMCGQPFLIPSPVGALAAEAPGGPGMYSPASASSSYAPPDAAAVEQRRRPPGGTEPQAPNQAHAEPSGAGTAGELPFPLGTRLTCRCSASLSQGARIGSAADMLNQFARCPQCQAQFTLRERDSVVPKEAFR